MRLAAAIIALAALAAPAFADDLPLTAEAFEAIVQGKTFDTYSDNGLYGVETFLPDRRSIWRDAEECKEGTWRAEGDQICFDYQGESQPFCWTYHDRGGWLMAWYEGDRTLEPIMLEPSEDFVTCEGFVGV
jgi:hypothetical protein